MGSGHSGPLSTGLFLVLLAPAAQLSALAPASVAQDPDVFLGATAVLFDNATVIDGRGGQPRPNSAILVWNGRIQAVGSRSRLQVPEGTAIIDLEGAYVVPGFIDAHATPRVARTLADMLAAGVTGVREAAMPLADFEARGRAPLGDEPLPAVFIGGAVLDAEGGPGLALGSADDIDAAVRRLIDVDGAAFVSVSPSIPAEWIIPLARETRRRDTPVWVDGRGAGWLTRVRAGADVTSHLISGDPDMLPVTDRPAAYGSPASSRVDVAGWLSALDPAGEPVRRAVDALLSRDAAVVPMLAVAEAELPCVSRDRPCDPTANRAERGRSSWSKAQALVRFLHHEGVRLLVGSGSPDETIAGDGFHRELRLLVEAGIPSLDVLSMATRNAAIALGILHDRGTLEAGKRADFVVLDANPVEDIEAARSVSFVVLEGKGWRPLAEGGFERLRFR